MALPELIEIVPLDGPVRARLTVPGSKSITNRALILAALAEGETVLRGALWSEDTRVMVESLQELGFMVTVSPSPEESSNRLITVYGRGGVVPPGGTETQPLGLFVGNAGTAARFLAALLCLGRGVYRLTGTPRMHERPQAGLFRALRELGYRVDSPNNKLPVVVHGGGPRPGQCQVNAEESSQFASALILCSKAGGWKCVLVGENPEASPYVAMTMELAKAFSRGGGTRDIDPDASSAGYFWGLDWLLNKGIQPGNGAHSPEPRGTEPGPGPSAGSTIEVVLPAGFAEDWQVDAHLPRLLETWPPEISRERDLGDSIMIAIVLASCRRGGGVFTDLGRLRLQECERVAALRTELTRCGAKVLEEGDTLRVEWSTLHGAEIETYHDHRMAMCFAILGLKIGGIKVKNPSCVKKTFPDFFQKLAAPVPAGLGARICDARSGRVLSGEDLLAS